MRYWLQLDEADQESFDAAAEQVSCCDEKTGIQALERASQPALPSLDLANGKMLTTSAMARAR